MANREYPHDIEAERSLLGAMLISKDKCIDILNKTNEDDFYDNNHQTIFKAMAAINDDNTPVDVTTVTSYLMDHNQLDKVGGVDYLFRLSEYNYSGFLYCDLRGVCYEWIYYSPGSCCKVGNHSQTSSNSMQVESY